MQSVNFKSKMEILLKQNKLPKESIHGIIAGALYFEKFGGISINKYWLNDDFDNRDEFFVILNSFFYLSNITKKLPYNNEWRLKFDVAFLFQIKSTAQSAMAIDLLTSQKCYPDAFVILRTMISRLNLLILFSFNPQLFDEWLKKPKDEKFLDGHIRKELQNNGISTVNHLYELTSEIIHNQYEALVNVGYFEKGLFPYIPSIDNQIYVIAKFVIGMSYQTVLSMLIQDCSDKNIPEELTKQDTFFNWLLSSYLLPNRVDQVFTFMAEDRHTEKVGKNKYLIGATFNFKELRIQIDKFYRKGQKKKLSKKYNISE